MAHQHSDHDPHEQEHEHRGSSVSTYVIVALILAVITYLEFAIVEYEIGWLSSGAILFWLIVMSLVKFFFVIWWFMHLKDDEAVYSGFFGSGMAIALGTFVVLAILFTVPSTLNRVRAQADLLEGATAAEAHGEEAGAHGEEADGHGGDLSDETLTLIESDGYSRDLTAVLDIPRPKNQRISLTLPPAPEVDTPLRPSPRLFGSASGAAAPAPDDASAGGAGIDDAEPAAEPEADETAPAAGAPQVAESDASADTSADDAPEDAAGTESAPEGAAASEADGATEDGAADLSAQAADPLDYDAELGAQVYSNCVGCHQANGEGIAGVFPPLAGWMPTLVAAEGGRDYLANSMLYGLQGQIEIDGQSYNGVMPPWAQLSDEQIAAVLNHELTSWGNAEQLPDGFAPFAPDEIAAARGRGLSADDVYEQRQALELP